MREHLTLKKSNCKNCYKCIRHCPVKAIRFSGDQAHIISSECILCGQCFVVCPQNAKQVNSQLEKVKVLLQSEPKVIVSLAPSFVASYDGVGINSMRESIKKLGFFDVEETAIGATIVKKEYERILREDNRDIVISSCCHTINLLIQKYFPLEMQYLADVMSPMQAHCLDIKRRYPDAKTVFIGPCVSKMDESDRYPGIVDAVLTFDDLSEWFREKGIVPEQSAIAIEESRARLFPTAGGILATMEKDAEGYSYISVDGIENCIEALSDIESGSVHKCFIEMSACTGSCIGGPIREKYSRAPMKDRLLIDRYAGKKDFVTEDVDPIHLKKGFDLIPRSFQVPTEHELLMILRRMGKFKPSDELNCGTCGYNTCREKAIAIYQGKAEPSMCLPFLKDKAESFSDTIVKNTPNGLIVLNEELEVQQINDVARGIMNIRSASDILQLPPTESKD